MYYPGFATSSTYIATDVGVFISTNFGSSWTELANGLPNTVAMHLDYHQAMKKLRLATHGRGVFEMQLSMPQLNVLVKAMPEGFYNVPTAKLNMRDTMRVYLRNISAPYAIVDSSVRVIDSVSLSASFTFNTAPTGTYYLMLKHRNSIETWSKAGGQFVQNGFTNNYDFTVSNTQAYGNNESLTGGLYGIYGGDINRSGNIDLTDIILVYNDAANFHEGYVQTDVTGDRLTDLSDIILTYNNSSHFVMVVRP